MLLKDSKWQLSPCFDINISLYSGAHSLTVDGNPASLENLIDNCSSFRLNKEKANEIINQIKQNAKTCLADKCKELNVAKELTKIIEKTIIVD